MNVNGIFGNQGVNYTTKVNTANNIHKTNQSLFSGKIDSTDYNVNFSKTPGNSGVTEATARGFLSQLNMIEQVGF